MRQYCIAAVKGQLEVDESTDVPALPLGKEALDRLESLRADVFGDAVLPDDSSDLLGSLWSTKSRRGANSIADRPRL